MVYDEQSLFHLVIEVPCLKTNLVVFSVECYLLAYSYQIKHIIGGLILTYFT